MTSSTASSTAGDAPASGLASFASSPRRTPTRRRGTASSSTMPRHSSAWDAGHALSSGALMYWLGSLARAQGLGFQPVEPHPIRRILASHVAVLVEAWHEYFGA